MQKKLTYEGN